MRARSRRKEKEGLPDLEQGAFPQRRATYALAIDADAILRPRVFDDPGASDPRETRMGGRHRSVWNPKRETTARRSDLDFASRAPSDDECVELGEIETPAACQRSSALEHEVQICVSTWAIDDRRTWERERCRH